MKYLFSFFTLLVYLIIAFFQNSMVTFAMQENVMSENMHHHQESDFFQNVDCCWDEADKSKDNCNHECCFKSDWVTVLNLVNLSQSDNKKEKIKIFSFVDIHLFSINSFSNKNLVSKTSPPLLLRDLKNYSYIDLIKIIKSNT
jgi:hypothetical protein